MPHTQKQKRDDITLCAFAMSLGFEVAGHNWQPLSDSEFTARGLPIHSLMFKRGTLSIWLTARGWRRSRTIGGVFDRPKDDEFFSSLYKALVASD
jgi:hypothetical protein